MPGFYENLLADALANSNYDVAGGQQNVENQQWGQLFGAAQKQFQMQQGSTLLDQLVGMQQNPYNVVTALRASGQAGGGTMGQLGALQDTGGVGYPGTFGPIVQRLIEEQAAATGGAPINPNTGYPFTPNELAYIRIILGRQGQAPTGGVDPTTGFSSYASAGGSAESSHPQTEGLAQAMGRIRNGSTSKRAGRYLNGSALSPGGG